MTYENRLESVIDTEEIVLSYSKNKHILKWWRDEHDQLLIKLISEMRWYWDNRSFQEIVRITPDEKIQIWRHSDPLCKEFVWYNVLFWFSISRARSKGFDQFIIRPVRKNCPLCHEEFVEDALPYSLASRLGFFQLDFCPVCIKDFMLQQTGKDNMSKTEVLEYLRLLANTLQSIPSQNFGEGLKDFLDFSFDERIKIFRVLMNKPTTKLVKKYFKNWLNALVKAGVLEDGTRRTSRGTQCLAKDGHLCFSLGEKTIDDILYALKIPHEREPRYPESNYRADFKISNVLIEYFGLAGDAVYDDRITEKKKLCTKHNLQLIAIYPKDVVNSEKLKEKFLRFMGAL